MVLQSTAGRRTGRHVTACPNAIDADSRLPNRAGDLEQREGYPGGGGRLAGLSALVVATVSLPLSCVLLVLSVGGLFSHDAVASNSTRAWSVAYASFGKLALASSLRHVGADVIVSATAAACPTSQTGSGTPPAVLLERPQRFPKLSVRSTFATLQNRNKACHSQHPPNPPPISLLNDVPTSPFMYTAWSPHAETGADASKDGVCERERGGGVATRR
jgi:hypothetical protein